MKNNLRKLFEGLNLGEIIVVRTSSILKLTPFGAVSKIAEGKGMISDIAKMAIEDDHVDQFQKMFNDQLRDAPASMKLMFDTDIIKALKYSISETTPMDHVDSVIDWVKSIGDNLEKTGKKFKSEAIVKVGGVAIGKLGDSVTLDMPLSPLDAIFQNPMDQLDSIFDLIKTKGEINITLAPSCEGRSHFIDWFEKKSATDELIDAYDDIVKKRNHLYGGNIHKGNSNIPGGFFYTSPRSGKTMFSKLLEEAERQNEGSMSEGIKRCNDMMLKEIFDTYDRMFPSEEHKEIDNSLTTPLKKDIIKKGHYYTNSSSFNIPTVKDVLFLDERMLMISSRDKMKELNYKFTVSDFHRDILKAIQHSSITIFRPSKEIRKKYSETCPQQAVVIKSKF